MAMTPVTPLLNLPLLAPTQADKTTPINDLITSMEGLTQDQMIVDMTAGDVTLGWINYTRHLVFRVRNIPASPARYLIVPLSTPLAAPAKRNFVVRNDSAHVINVTGGSGLGVSINAGSGAIILSDGVDLISLSALVSGLVTSVAGLSGIISLAQLIGAGVAPLASPTFTGAVTVPAISDATTSDAHAASTSFVQAVVAAGTQNFSFAVAWDSQPIPGRVVVVPFPYACALPANMAGSVGLAEATAAAAAVFTIARMSGATRTAIGTITFATGATAPTLSSSSLTAFAAGDALEITPPSPRDGTLARCSLTFFMHKT